MLGDRNLSYPSWMENGRSWWNTCRFPCTHKRLNAGTAKKPMCWAVSGTHTLHQVESFFREEVLLAICREAHSLPKLALKTNRLSETHRKAIYNKTSW